MMNRRKKRIMWLAITILIIGAGLWRAGVAETAPADIRLKIENAMFARREFFGTEALFPHPTAEASENLARLAVELPDNPEILEHLAETEEKLDRFDSAEKVLIRLSEIDGSKSQNLISFYHRRARFADEGKILENLLSNPETENKDVLVGVLLDLASIHDLKEYLRPEFYSHVIAENPGIFPVFEKLADRLIEEKNYAPALELIREAKKQFPDQRSVLLDKEIFILEATGRDTEAEKAYSAEFDPFWTDHENDKFYSFLNERDRLREYGTELKQKFASDPANFDTAIRLADYRKYRGDEIWPIIERLWKAKTGWTTGELVIVTRLLLRENEGSLASRFLYTLYARNDFKEKGELRARVLYQLFEMFSDAETQRLPITRGNLQFYEEIATTDTDPGITTGILSLIFSDADPRGEFEKQEALANKYFNRAAAYKVFLAYREEFPASPELYQMYLDLIRLYIATKELAVAKKLLNEFAEHYTESKDFPQAALKLADAIEAAGDQQRSREVCREILDHLGKRGSPMSPAAMAFGDRNEHFNAPINFDRNIGINIPPPKKTTDTSENSYEPQFKDYLDHKNEPVTYAEVLEKMTASLAREKKTVEILQLYSNEIGKYPQAEWLYERRLTWLEQTNLTEEQLAVYREALDRFKTTAWSDKLARWFIRQKRQDDLAELSSDLISRLSDAEVQNYLTQTIDPGLSGSDFDKQMRLRLYLASHARFPHNISFVKGLLSYYRGSKLEAEWRKLAGEYYFISGEIRQMFLDDLAAKGDLRIHLATANGDDLAYETFRADAALRLSNFEQAVDTYRQLSAAYPNSRDIAGRLIELSRSLGQKDTAALAQASEIAMARADHTASSAEFRTMSGEIYAELGDYKKAGEEWEKLITTAVGNRETYLDTATIYWDYFQYRAALQTIERLRTKFGDDDLYAFEAGAIRESLHDKDNALREYVKALGSKDEDKERAKSRLATLSKKGVQSHIEQAFLSEGKNTKNAAYLALGYADYLIAVEKPDEAARTLNTAISASRDKGFLESALDLYSSNELAAGEQHALARLAEVSESPRRSIGYRLRLVRSYQQARDRDKAKRSLADLLAKFPTNYGVVTEASDLYRSLGFENESTAVLNNALAKSRGVYKNKIAGKLSRHLIDLGRLDEAERILSGLHADDPADTALFRELATIFVRRSEPEAMRAAFRETIRTLKASDSEPRELDDQIAELRVQMIDAFTRLKDYDSAIEQHIEIINREPENEDLTEDAISYVRRYGGSGTLLAYYQKTSAEAFKNYRWNLVLARIYEANGDLENAIKNFGAAIDNQPEMAELYDARADLEVKRGNFESAIKDIDSALEITGDAPEYVKKKIAILKKVGRNKDAEAELPLEAPAAPVNDFAAARELQNTEKEKARELYRAAFQSLIADPLYGELKTANIVDYVRSVRDEEPLDKISTRLWELRQKLIDLADEQDSTRASEARNRLIILDGAMTASIGELAGSVATDEELAALHNDLANRIERAPLTDQYRTLDQIIDITRKAHFGDLEELTLRKRIENTTDTSRQTQIRHLIDFYSQRGAYDKSLAAMEEFGSEDLAGKAQAARLAGDDEKELVALRAIYTKPKAESAPVPDLNVARYLQILHEHGRDELTSLATESSPYQLQLINFLLGKGEFELTQAAIESAEMPRSWKLSRRAEVDLALRKFGENAECNFCEALRLTTIGEMTEQAAVKDEFPVGDDWFRLATEYGEWLDLSPVRSVKPSLYLNALTEAQPRNHKYQSKLGTFYLLKKDHVAAAQHFRLTVELAPRDVAASSDLGATYFLAGKPLEADKIWSDILGEQGLGNMLVFFEELNKFGLSAEAGKRVAPRIVKYLEKSNIDDSEETKDLVRAIAGSIKDSGHRAEYFRVILDKRPTDTSLATMLIDESLLDENDTDAFYRRLIDLNEGITWEEDYAYSSIIRRTWTREDAESAFDQENKYEVEEPENDRYKWQKRYLESLISRKRNDQAAKLIGEIEKGLKGKYPRPGWLRLAQMRIAARAGRFNIEEAERFAGISVSGSATEIIPSSLERFNDVVKMLRDEGKSAEANTLSESYFARMLAMEQYDPANFAGLARVFLVRSELQKALRLLELMVETGSQTSMERAMAEIAALDIVKRHAPDAAKTGELSASASAKQTTLLNLAADLVSEFHQTEAAIGFRQRFNAIDPSNEANTLALSKLLISAGRKPEAIDLLNQLIANRNTSRISRWRAKWELHEMGEKTEISDLSCDPFSQYYRALAAEKGGDAIAYLINSLIAGGDSQPQTKRALIRQYALADIHFAALKLAESDKAEKPDELLSLLSDAAENIGNFSKAIEFEKLRTDGGDTAHIRDLEAKETESKRRATDLVIDTAITRKL